MKTLGAIAAAFLLSTQAHAAQIVLGENSVVGTTSDLSPQFSAKNIFDRQTGDQLSETSQDGSYWLSAGGNAFITIDLGSAQSGLSFDLFNTHNASYFDHGTGNFEIFASNELTENGNFGFTLGGDIEKILGGTMLAELDDPITAQSFAANNATAYRYIQFRALSAAAAGGSTHTRGLNEMRVHTNPVAAVPEPASWAMMIAGFGLVGGSMRRRSSAPAAFAR